MTNIPKRVIFGKTISVADKTAVNKVLDEFNIKTHANYPTWYVEIKIGGYPQMHGKSTYVVSKLNAKKIKELQAIKPNIEGIAVFMRDYYKNYKN